MSSPAFSKDSIIDTFDGSRINSPTQGPSKKGSYGGTDDPKYKSFYSSNSAAPEFRIGTGVMEVKLLEEK